MSKPLLPSLKKGNNVQDPSSGQWDARNAKELENISEGLEVNQVEIQINSIPDVWARPLLFEMALLSPETGDKKHPLRDQILGEWRGLLAMLALKEIKNLNVLTAKKVEVKLNNNHPTADDNEVNDNQPDNVKKLSTPIFLESLCKLIPKKTIAADTSWEHLYLFLFKVGHQNRPIGMTSPTTLVFTPTYYYNYIDQNKVPWFDGKILQDPINYLSKQQKAALAGWLDVLKQNLSNHIHPLNESIWNSLSGLLNKFTSDLRVTAQVSTGATSLGIEKNSGIFFYLDKPAGVTKSSESDVCLVASANRTPTTPLLLIDKHIATEWGVHPRDVSVSNTATLADIPANGLITRHQIGSHTIDNAELWQPKELFTEKLFVVKNDNAFSGAKQESWLQDIKPQLNNQPISIILPVTQKLIEYLDEDELLKRLKFQQGPGGEITVQLSLTLGTNPQRTYEVKKTYARNEIFNFDQIPAIEVFPNFKKDNWKAYYVAYSAVDRKNTFQVKPYSSFTETVDKPEPDQPNVKWQFKSSVEEAKIPINNNPNGERLIWRLESYPNVLVCSALDETGSNQKAGLLLLKSPQPLPPVNRAFTVGIDFGASGTSVYKSPNGNKEPLKFENRKLSVTDLSFTQKSELFDYFLPPKDFEIPFLTIFQDFNNQASGNYSCITNGHIYYVEDKKLPENIFTDLKWSENDQHNLYAEAFLTQLCLQTAAELVQEGASAIDWKFSYPTAFSTTHLGNFQPIWQRITGNISSLTGISSTNSSNLTESVATALFFRDDTQDKSHKAQTALGTVFVDIGSSTSDISVWQGNNLLWQVSLLYAGRDILLDYLYKNPNVLNDLGLSFTSTNNRTHFYAQMDAILRKDSELIFSKLLGKDLKELKKHLALGLSGLFYYIGLGIRCLRQKEIYNKPEMPHFYFGGNGSQIFRWLVNGQQWDKSDLAKLFDPLFETVFTKGLGEKLNGFFKLEMSNLPKKEAAFGLVCHNTLNAPADSNKKVFAGENYIENKTTHPWSEVLDGKRLTDSLQPPEKLEKLSEFIEEFNNFAVKSEGLVKKFDSNERKLSTVRGLLANNLADLAKMHAKDEQVVVQPIFILALKHLLKS